MEFPALKEAQGKLDAARKSLADVMAEAKTSSAGTYDMDAIKSVPGSKADKLAWIQARNEELTGLKADVEREKSVAQAAQFASEHTPQHKGSDEGAERKGGGSSLSLSEAFVKSAAFKNKGAKAHLDVDLKADFRRDAGWQPEATRSGLVTLIPMERAPSIADHIQSIPVSQVAYKYMEETTYTNTAAETAEGDEFHEAALGLTERSQTVEKITVWLPMTDEQLEDEPGAEAYVRARLDNMLRQRLDRQILQGSGAGSPTQLLGTVNKAGIQTRVFNTDSTLIDESYRLFTQIRTDGFAEPSVVFIQPVDWTSVALLKTADGQYIYSNPAGRVASVLWGVPVVQTMAAPAATLVTGDYASYAFLGVKRGVDVQVTNTHDDFFTHGKQAIRMDFRVVMVHIRPKAFGKLTGLPTP